ncbi:hypothetical protein [Bradyrhizobium sp. Mp27]|uniref:hypothetical protein n=1 Tax=Bradyrhizobium sp. Mp27 TaxID=3042157 RepID=UPI00248D0B0E|nr:hypothetical protein [Bradyrhizobium sp. Mp27]MDI2076637.1 hypothetical protein [Bradyrhizobium sp. Mp27]
MRHLRWLAAQSIGALGVAGLLASSVLAQAPDINPPVANCNMTPEAVEVTPPGSTKPREFKATPIITDLLKSGQPCQQIVSAAGRAGDDTVTNRQRGFDFYSWLTFIAMNSPADGKTTIGKGPRPGGDAMTMWEDLQNYRPLADVMLNDADKRKWGTRHVPDQCKSLDGPGKIVFHLGEEAFNQPFKTGPLIDQDGNYALFDILMNKPMFDFIETNTLYSRAGQAKFDKEIDFPTGVNPGKDAAGNPTPGRMGAIMLKVAYRILDPVANADLIKQFHTSDALIFFPGPPLTKTGPICVEKKLGLIGFHVGHKTRFAPQWVWTSFEHVSNVPDEADVKAGKLPLKRYSFFKENCKDCAEANATPEKPWHPPASLKFPASFRSQVVRAKMIPTHTQKDVDQLNQSFRKILKGTVWENYILLTTQWPSEFDSKTDPTGAPAPTYLANTTLETYSQGKSPLASSSCMACHGNAVSFQRREVDPAKFDGKPFNQSDFTFILEKAVP